MMELNGLVDRAKAAEILGVKPQALAVWKMEGRGPQPRMKIGVSWFYDKAEIEEFARMRTLTIRNHSRPNHSR